MAINRGPKIVTSGLILALDAADKNSYPGSGTTWYDLTNNGNNGTLVATPTYSNTNLGDFNFNGTTQKITVPIAGSPTCYCFDIAIKQWQAVPPNTNMGPYFSCVGITAAAYSGIGLNIGEWTSGATDETISWWSNVNAYATYIRDTVSFAYHIYTFNWNGTTYDIWLDGIKRTTYQRTNGHATLITGVTSMSIGYNENWAYWFKGNIGNIKMYNRVLTDSEILQNYNATKSRFGL